VSILFLSEEYGRGLHRHFQVASAGAFDWAQEVGNLLGSGVAQQQRAECLKGIAQATELLSAVTLPVTRRGTHSSLPTDEEL
jgi:hypothetical protein